MELLPEGPSPLLACISYPGGLTRYRGRGFAARKAPRNAPASARAGSWLSSRSGCVSRTDRMVSRPYMNFLHSTRRFWRRTSSRVGGVWPLNNLDHIHRYLVTSSFVRMHLSAGLSNTASHSVSVMWSWPGTSVLQPPRMCVSLFSAVLKKLKHRRWGQ